MKHPEEFSDEAVNKRSAQASQALAVAARSAKVKRELDDARMDKKERRPLKEFTTFRTEISEHVGVPAHSMPPNILILRRKTIRQFPNNVMVALYFNDKLGQYFSIPYGSVAPDDAVITPVALKEEISKEKIEAHAKRDHETVEDAKGEEERKERPSAFRPRGGASAALQRSQHSRGHLNETVHEVGDEVRYRLGTEGHLRVGTVKQVMPEHLVVKRDNSHYKVPKDTVVHNSRTGYTREELNEDAISHLKKVVAFKTSTPLNHKDGTSTRIDPTTANALLTVHKSLHPDNQKKFADAVEHSKPQFARMLDFAWRQVK